jgi:ribosomal protein L15
LKNLLVISGLVVALATGASVAQAGPGHSGDHSRADSPRAESKSKGQSKRCAKVRKVGFVVAGTYVSGDATSVTLLVTRVNRHAKKSGLVTVGEQYTATPTKASRIRYVNRSGPADAQPTDRVRVVGKVTVQKRKCATEDFTPEATVRKVTVTGPETASEGENENDS